ncbi:MAG: hypothetical protein HYV90_03935 [Candidatus Woesebacteria bacterium]|nr:MAG: hypothetical protein HYV90_03935 [Candidatus Woesebacteria bacterium]
MSDSLSDKDLLKSFEAGKIHGEGAVLGDSKFNKFLGTFHRLEVESHLPKTEIVKPSPEIRIEDFRDIPEEKITDIICKTWGETPDTLTSSYIASYEETENGPRMIITEMFESTNPPEGVNKVTYQFARKGEYEDDTKFSETEIVRFEFREIDPYNDRGGGVLVPVGLNSSPQNPEWKKPETETALNENQTFDNESGMLVTYYSVPVIL